MIRPDAEQLAAHDRLVSILADLAESGRPAPCVKTPVAEWTSEDAGDQEYIARLCLGCFARTACHEYITAYPEPAGVWAGLTESDRAPRRGRPPKEKNADD